MQKWTKWDWPCCISVVMQRKENMCLTVLLKKMNCVHWYQPKSKCASMQWKRPSSPCVNKCKDMLLRGNINLTVFWDSQGVPLTNFQRKDNNVNANCIVKFCWCFWMQLEKNVQTCWLEEYCSSWQCQTTDGSINPEKNGPTKMGTSGTFTLQT